MFVALQFTQLWIHWLIFSNDFQWNGFDCKKIEIGIDIVCDMCEEKYKIIVKKTLTLQESTDNCLYAKDSNSLPLIFRIYKSIRTFAVKLYMFMRIIRFFLFLYFQHAKSKANRRRESLIKVREKKTTHFIDENKNICEFLFIFRLSVFVLFLFLFLIFSNSISNSSTSANKLETYFVFAVSYSYTCSEK